MILLLILTIGGMFFGGLGGAAIGFLIGIILIMAGGD
jgi:hypothetical protein